MSAVPAEDKDSAAAAVALLLSAGGDPVKQATTVALLLSRISELRTDLASKEASIAMVDDARA